MTIQGWTAIISCALMLFGNLLALAVAWGKFYEAMVGLKARLDKIEREIGEPHLPERMTRIEGWMDAHIVHARIEEEQLRRLGESVAVLISFVEIYRPKLDRILERMEGLRS